MDGLFYIILMMNEYIQVGRIGRPHGLKGFLYLNGCDKDTISSIGYEHWIFFAKKELSTIAVHQLDDLFGKNIDDYVGFRCNQIKKQSTTLLLHIDGINTRDDVLAYVNCTIYITRESLPPAEDDMYYYGDLRGCKCVFDGKTVGSVLEVCNFGSCDLLKIEHSIPNTQPKQSKIIYVPFLKKYCKIIDIQNKSIEFLNNVEGFF